MPRDLGCYPRLGCGWRTRRLGCFPKDISCPGWCLHSCRWLGVTLLPYITVSLIYIIFLLLTPFGIQPYVNLRSQPWKGPLLVDHSLCRSCGSADCLIRSLGSSLACISCLVCCSETLSASLLAGNLVAGRVFLSCLFCSDKHSIFLL